MADAAAGGTWMNDKEWTRILESVRILYKNNYIDERQFKSLVWDVVENEVEDEQEGLRILRAAGVIRSVKE